MRLIDADALREVHCQYCSEAIRNGCKDDPVCASLLWVDEAPTVDAVPVKHGQWILDLDKDGFLCSAWRKCSSCGCLNVSEKPPYCPNCGAKMDGEPE